MIGTPKTFNQAVLNALNEWAKNKGYNVQELEDVQTLLYLHIRDYFSQKFTVAMIKANSKPFNDNDLRQFFLELFSQEKPLNEK